MLRGVRRFRGGADHAFDRDALQDRHRPLDRGAPQLRAQDRPAELRPECADVGDRGERAAFSASSARSAGGAGLARGWPTSAPALAHRPAPRPAGAASARVLAARGIDARRRRRTSSSRRCASCCPIPSHLKDMDAAAARLAARDAGRRADRGVRRLRRRRRHLVGAAAALLPRRRRRRRASTSPTACRKATARTRRRCCSLQAEGAARRRHGRLRHHRLRAAGRGGERPGSTSSSSTTTWPSRAAARHRRGQSEPARRDQPAQQLAAVGVAFLLVVGVNRALRAGRLVRRARPEPDLRELARPRGARHGLRRRAAHRPQPRAGGAGPEGDGASAATPGSRRSPTWRG